MNKKCVQNFRIFLGLNVSNCELFDLERWIRINREDSERGRECYRISSGYFYCKDRNENQVY